MLRWSDITEIPSGFGPCVVTLGNFDGVHRGHQAVVRTAVERARELGCPAVVVTFEPHPIAVLRPDVAPSRITSAAQRLDLLADLGVDAVLQMAFTPELATWSPRQFVHDVFVNALNARLVVVGADTRFGHRNSGDVTTLRELGAAFGFEVAVVSDVGHGQRWSSTQVRDRLIAGDVAGANDILGRRHRVTGTVVHGAHRGRELGFPTANLDPNPEGMVPAAGVYAGWLVRLDQPLHSPERTLPTAVSIGTNPTFEGTTQTVEAYVLDRTDLDLYGERVAIDFVAHLRPTLKFDSIADLLDHMHADVEHCRPLLPKTGPEPFAARNAGRIA